jgi:UrcA family protein
VFFSTLAAMAVLAAGSAQASSPDMRIRIADLDLNRAADVAIARSRIEQSTHQFCSHLSAYPLTGDRTACRKAMQAAAIAQLTEARANSDARLASR